MKKQLIIRTIGVLFVFAVSLLAGRVNAQEAEKSPLVLGLSYFSSDNSMQYITVTAKSKVQGKFQPVKGVEIKLYLDKDSTGKPLGFIGKVVTGEKGKAAANILPPLSPVWKSSINHTFIAVAEKSNRFDETNTELNIAKAKITVDTGDDKNLSATLTEFKGGAWVPVKGVDIKLCVKRLGGDLPINDKDSYTTDSTGKVTGEFKRTGLPGDKDGNLMLVAKVEDNDTYGNLRVEKSIPWGSKFVADDAFFQRTALWGSRFHSPMWLIFMAYSIIIAVWGTLIYLVFLLIKIRKLGQEEEPLK